MKSISGHQRVAANTSGHGPSGKLASVKLAAPSNPRTTPVKTPMPNGKRKA